MGTGDTKTFGQMIRELCPGRFKTLTKVSPLGALEARKQVSGAVTLHWRFTFQDKVERPAIGLYDPSAPPKKLEPTERGYSIAAAVRAAEAMATEHHKHRDQGGRPALLNKKRAERKSAEQEKASLQEFTLGRLCDEYCDYLQGLGRRSHSDARSIFRLHIKEPWPNLADQPARELTPEQFADMMRRLMDAGKGRTANKMRSYAHSAYQIAKSARSNAKIPVVFKGFNITVNPIGDTVPDGTQNRSGKRPLTTSDMRVYWGIIKSMSDLKGVMLRLHLLTGAQRIAQFVRLLTKDAGQDVIVLLDGKGRPGHAARRHAVPLIEQAGQALAECKPQGMYALSTDGGATHVAPTTLSSWAVEAVGEKINEFQAKRLRSGVETLLASAGIPKDHRGRLQSHGISGVQNTSYDGYDYMSEKLEALLTLYDLLESRTSSIPS